jgi:TPP-dependent pyruvate/acetoin dehydrogenase alpha subunit
MENAISADIMAEIEDARAFARATPLPDPSQATWHVYA